MRSFLPSRRFLKDKRLPEGKGGPFGAPSALSVYIVLLRKGMSQWFKKGRSAARVQKVQRVVVAADAADYKKGARLRRGLCRRVVEKGS